MYTVLDSQYWLLSLSARSEERWPIQVQRPESCLSNPILYVRTLFLYPTGTPNSEYTRPVRGKTPVAISQRNAIPENMMHLAGAAMIAETKAAGHAGVKHALHDNHGRTIMSNTLGEIGEFALNEKTIRGRVEALTTKIETAAIAAVNAIVGVGAERADTAESIGCKLGEARLEVYLNPAWTGRNECEDGERIAGSAQAAAQAVKLHKRTSGQAHYRADVVVSLDRKTVHAETIVVIATGENECSSAVITAKHESVEDIANDREYSAGGAVARWAAKTGEISNRNERPDTDVDLSDEALTEHWGKLLLRHARA